MLAPVARAIAGQVGRGFTLIELLIVVAIIALLVSILLPALSTARELSQSAVCASNNHGLYMAAAMYASDFDGWLGPTEMYYWAPFWPTNPPMPPQLVNKGLDFHSPSPVDFYAAMDYIPFGVIGKDLLGDPSRGNEIFMCPVAQTKLVGKFWRQYASGVGSLVCYNCFSGLLYHFYGPEFRSYRSGPYKPEELADAATAILSGDAEVYYYATGYPPGYGTPADYAFAMGYWQGNVGSRATCFGAIVTWVGLLGDNYQYYHTFGPNGLFFDGHVENITPPPLSTPQAMLKNFTRDARVRMP